MSNQRPVCFGLDLAKSVDFTCLIGLDAKRKVCVFERFQKSWLDTTETIRRIVGNVPCLTDSTGIGDSILESLQAGRRQNFEGFKFSSPSKQQLMESLSLAIQRQEIFFPAGVITNELEAFEYEFSRTGVKYSAPSGMHDDAVCALALANFHKPKPVARFYSQ
jgi:hypothetical protein